MIPHYHEDLHALHVHAMPHRAYYVPASRRVDNLTVRREASDRIQFLNRTWKFRYFPALDEMR